MASIEAHHAGGWRVRYRLRLPGRLLQRERRLQNRGQAELLQGRLTALEQAVSLGLASLAEIRQWVSRGWLSDVEAREAFTGYADQVPAVVTVNLAALERAYEAYALDHSKARDAGRKAHLNHMSAARQILAWLGEAHPTLRLTAADVQAWVSHLATRGYSESSRHTYLTKLRILLDLAVDLGMAEGNPARQVGMVTVRRQEVRRVLSLAEAQRLLAASLDYRGPISGSLPTVVRLGLYAGLRNEEMCWLTWGALDLERRVLHVQRTTAPSGEVWRPKDAELRSLDLHPELARYLEGERVRQEGVGLVGFFVLPGGHGKKPQYRGRPLTPDKPQRAMRGLVAALGMDPRITVYSLRHTFGTMLLRAGVDIETVRRRLGHADIRTTAGYLHALEVEARPLDALPY